MTSLEQVHKNHNQAPSPCQGAPDGELEADMEDFERDESLRRLRLEEWFATAEPGVPIWCY